MTPEELEQIAEYRTRGAGGYPHTVNVCVAAGCLSCQSQAVKDALDKEGHCAVDPRRHCKVKGRWLHGPVRRRTPGLNQ